MECGLKGLDGGLDLLLLLLLFSWQGARDEGDACEETAIQAGDGWKELSEGLLVLLVACQHGKLECGDMVDDMAGPEGRVRVDALEKSTQPSSTMPRYLVSSLPGKVKTTGKTAMHQELVLTGRASAAGLHLAASSLTVKISPTFLVHSSGMSTRPPIRTTALWAIERG